MVGQGTLVAHPRGVRATPQGSKNPPTTLSRETAPLPGQNRLKMGQNSPFWAFFGFREPTKAGGNRPRAAKKGSKGHRNVFWDRFRPFGCHFSAFRAETENRKIVDFLTILGYFGPFLALFGPFLDPQMASGAQKDNGEPTKIGQKGIKRP